jgi:hypothetical protein
VEAGEEDNTQGVFAIVSLNTAAVREILLHRKPVSAGNLDSVFSHAGATGCLSNKIVVAVLRGKVNTYCNFSVGNNIN